MVFRISCLLIVSVIVFGGCLIYIPSGVSSSRLKNRYLNSYVVVTAQRFYPDPHSGSPLRRAKLDDTAQQALKDELTDMARRVVRPPSSIKKYVAAAFDVRSRLSSSPIIHVIETDDAIANSPRPGEIAVAVAIPDAFFRSALLDTESRNPTAQLIAGRQVNFEPITPGLLNKQSAAVAKLIQEITTVREVNAKNDMQETWSFLTDRNFNPFQQPRFQIGEKLDKVELLEIMFRGALLFLFAHEWGHTALRHHGLNENLCRIREYEADAYAVVLLGYAIHQEARDRKSSGLLPSTLWQRQMSSQAVGDADAPVHHLDFEDMFAFGTGFQNFFEYAFRLAGFGMSGPDDACEYPSPKERFQAAVTLYDQLRTARWNQPRDIIRSHIQNLGAVSGNR